MIFEALLFTEVVLSFCNVSAKTIGVECDVEVAFLADDVL